MVRRSRATSPGGCPIGRRTSVPVRMKPRPPLPPGPFLVVGLARSGQAAAALLHARGEEVIADLLDLPLARYPHDILLPRIWELRDNFSAYDAAYLALAEGLSDEGVPLLTTDGRLARAVHAHSAVEVLSA